MKQRTIAMRCIADTQRGFGNLNRCITLAEEMQEKGFNVIFIVNYNNLVLKELRKRKFQYILIPKSISYKQESFFIIKTMNSKKYQSIVVDMREYSQNLTNKLCGNNFKIILLDDAWCRKAYADIIFNGTMIKQYHLYEKINKDSKIFVGSKYFIINKEFIKHQKKSSEIFYKKKYCVVVSMGGSDPNGLTLLVVKSILSLDNIQVRVITGPLFKDQVRLQKLVKNKKNVTLIHSPHKIWKEFLKADIVISNSGNTLFELAVLKVPTICIPAIEHQVPYAKAFMTKGFTVSLGWWKKVRCESIRKAVVKILNDVRKRKKMSLSGSKIVDGKGLSRVTNIIEKIILIKT